MTQRTRLAAALVSSVALLSGVAAAAPAPAKAAPVQEVITIQRTATSGLAALALIGKVQAKDVPGFFASVDRYGSDATLGSFADFNQPSGLTRYGHGSSAPLCDAPVVCAVDKTTGSLTFTITETDDADDKYSPWVGLTRYLAIRGTKVDLQVAAIGFTVRRHTASTFARVTKAEADADGAGVGGAGAEVFRAAQLPGGKRGSFVALQLPCEAAGAGAVTFVATGDVVPPLANCSPTDSGAAGSVYVGTVGVTRYHDRSGLYSRTADGATSWQVSGAVTGVSGSDTRLFVLSY